MTKAYTYKNPDNFDDILRAYGKQDILLFQQHRTEIEGLFSQDILPMFLGISGLKFGGYDKRHEIVTVALFELIDLMKGVKEYYPLKDTPVCRIDGSEHLLFLALENHSVYTYEPEWCRMALKKRDFRAVTIQQKTNWKGKVEYWKNNQRVFPRLKLDTSNCPHIVQILESASNG
jgi:hypothetical protein